MVQLGGVVLAAAVMGPLAAACGDTYEDADDALPCAADDDCGPAGMCVGGRCEGGTTTASDSATTSGAGSTTGDGSAGVELAVNKDVDVLFVIDNSGTMGEEQGTLARDIAAFFAVLERPSVAANYRIGVTTTDNGNPLCPGTSPEGGALRLSTCRSRTQEFVFDGAVTVDATLQACFDVCAYDQIEIFPTATALDPNEVARPWLESIAGTTNIGMGRRASTGAMEPVTAAQAFRCFGPQGINGCGFESQLESMWKGLARSVGNGEASYGFLRDNAVLAVVHVTDEADCSAKTEFRGIFLREDQCAEQGVDAAQCTRAFWSDPTAVLPTSAVCWNAGTDCKPSGDGTYSCRAANNAVDGQSTSDESQAVLWPVRRYVDELLRIEDAKRGSVADQEVVVGVIAGVPEGYENGGDIVYQDALSDPSYQNNFGIGPGCSGAGGNAVPPVRLKAFAEAFEVGGDRNLFSVCSASYEPALAAIAEAIADQLKPACMPSCVADQTPGDGVVDPQCAVTQQVPGQPDEPIPPCVLTCGGDDCAAGQERNADGERQPTGAAVCFVPLTDPSGTQTPSPLDDMDPACVSGGYNLEFRLLRTGAPPPGSRVRGECTPSEAIATDCPNLP
jgi:hypothetical protein